MDFGEIFGPAVVVFVLVLVFGLAAVFVSRILQGKKLGIYKEYLKVNFSDWPDELLMANQKSKSAAFDIGLVNNESEKKLLLLFKIKNEMTHKVFSYEDLREVNSSSEVISRGLPTQKTYSYQRTMTISFNDGSSYQFILETISDKRGVKGKEIVLDTFKPWESILNQIIG